ncbi:HlyD family type I secretion periplasmic adaptor subunit [Orrella sp. 11846]|uniref:HlyD family type I secretion periplasmic adaptor subunit n=1 Tax=Orrella sp. 11846 TaxID=3409913 RepID=UPI003B5B9F47
MFQWQRSFWCLNPLSFGETSSQTQADKDELYKTLDEQQARGARSLLWISLFAIVALVAWATYAYIDEVVRGEGKVVPSRQVQIIQSLDGGIVEEILVREGERVEKGQVLLRVDPTRFFSTLGENKAERLALLAKAARLKALANNEAFEDPQEVLAENPELIAQERRVWETKTEEMQATINQASDQLLQRRNELLEVQATHEQAVESCELTTQELSLTEPLLRSGAVSEVDLIRLRREKVRMCGEAKSTAAQLERIRASIAEAESKLVESSLSMRNQARVELSDVKSRLSALREEHVGLADRVRLAEIRSPVNGTVKSLMANTLGGVIQPGKDIIEIVPLDDTLLLEVKIHPRDIGFLRPGQKAEVKFTAYDFAIYGGLEGVVEQIGADTITDEQGNSFYLVRVRTDNAFVRDDSLPILPGMVAETHIMTGKRTVMQYLLKPVLRAKSNAFTER